jgi:hypothetical protein
MVTPKKIVAELRLGTLDFGERSIYSCPKQHLFVVVSNLAVDNKSKGQDGSTIFV